ncbi:Transcription factor bye1 [Saitoella coloradoensis]
MDWPPPMSSMEALLGAAAAAAAQNDLTDDDGHGEATVELVTRDAVAEHEETPPAPVESQGKRDWDATDSESDDDEETQRPKKRAPPKKASSRSPSPPPAPPYNAAAEEVGVEDEEDDDDDQTLYCICRKPQGKRWMIQCDGCDDWFHGTCVNINEVDEGLIDKWYCPHCEEYKGRTTWKRKCRLGGCRKPAAMGEAEQEGGGKYCSREHGVVFMKSVIQNSLLPATEIKALLVSASTPTEFRTLGDRAPTPPPLLDSPDTDIGTGTNTEDDIRVYRAKMERITETRTRVQARLDICAKRREFLRYARDRAKQRTEDLRAEDSAVKDICGFDPRLIMSDSEFAALREDEDDEEMCHVEKKKCARHMSWQHIRQEEIELEETLVWEEMKRLEREEEKVRGVVVRRGVVVAMGNEGEREGKVVHLKREHGHEARVEELEISTTIEGTPAALEASALQTPPLAGGAGAGAGGEVEGEVVGVQAAGE